MNKLKELIKQAKEAVEDLDEPLKTEGFKVILTKLLEAQKDESKIEKVSRPRNTELVPGKDNAIAKICSELNRTKYPKMYHLKKALDRSLYILQIAREDFNVGGLLPLQISKILNTVFRIKTSAAAVNMALGKATSYVDRKPIKVQGGQGYKYILMHEGEKYVGKTLKDGKDK